MYSILLVDDEAVEREGVSFLLRQGNYPFDIFQAPNGKKAWEFLQQHPVDVLLTDVKMPFMDGLELSKLVCDYFADTTIIIFSAYSEFEYAKRAMEAKAIHYLLKPIEVDEFHELMARVTTLCEQKIKRKMEDQTHEKNDQKLVLMQILSGTAKPIEGLLQCGLDLSGCYLRLIHLETQSDYFVSQEEGFLKLVSACVTCPFVMVGFYPNSTFLLLYNRVLIKDEAVAYSMQQICKEIHRIHGQSVSALCGACLHDAEALSAEAATLLKFRQRLYTAQGSVLFIHDFLLQETLLSADVETTRSALSTAIERRDIPAIEKQLAALFQELSLIKTFSNTYLNHILYDLTTRLYIRFDHYSSQMVAKQMEELLNCAGMEQLQARMLQMVAELRDSEPASANSEATNTVKKVLRIIRHEYASVLSLDCLAERTGLTPSYLSTLFKQETGENLIKYITDYRLKQACAMLEEGSTKVNQVAKACGYDNVSYFNRIFKAHYGITPSKLRGREEE